MKITVKRISDSSSYDLNIEPNDLVSDVMRLISEKYTPDISALEMRLVYKGKSLDPTFPIDSFGIADGSIIHCVRHSSHSSNLPSTTSATSASTATLVGAPFPSQFQDLQTQMLNQPQLFDDMMNSDAMKSVLNNPELMNSIINMNPQMKQVMEENPELREMMNDPAFIQQTMDAAKNPNVMKEMMRNTDRAMANIESIPGGHDALNRMYHQIAEPLFEASANTDPNAGKIASNVNYSASDENNEDVPMPNPWNNGSLGGNSREAPLNSQVPEMLANPQVANLLAASMGTSGQTTNAPMSDPMAINQLFSNPQLISSLLNLENSFNAAQGGSNSNTPQNISTDFNQMFNPYLAQLNSNAGNTTNTSSAVSPEIRFRTQLHTLHSMGFTDRVKNIDALSRVDGNVNRAIDILLQG